MERREDKFATLVGGKELVVTVLMEGCQVQETVKVRQLAIKEYPKLLPIMEDECASAELYCDRPKGWGETLTRESLEEVIMVAEALNGDFFARWAQRRLRRAESIQPGIMQQVLASLPSTPPKSPPTAG